MYSAIFSDRQEESFSQRCGKSISNVIRSSSLTLPLGDIVFVTLLKAVTVTFILFINTVFADSFDINMSNNTAQVIVGTSPQGMPSDANAEFQTAVLYNNDQGNILAEAGMLSKGVQPSEDDQGDVKNGTSPGFKPGGRGGFLLGSLHQGSFTRTVSCFAFGPAMVYTFPTSVPISVVAEYQVSLKIISFFDADRYSKVGLRIEAEVPNAKIYLGYRQISFGITGAGDAILDKGVFVGLNITSLDLHSILEHIRAIW